MLGKLIKHELKATNRLLVPLYLALLGISIINHFLFPSAINGGFLGLFVGFLIVAQVVLAIAILFTTIIFMIIRFYKNLLGDEGYLMFTLPVKAYQLIISKLIVTLFWLVISLVIILISLYVAFSASVNMNIILKEIKFAFSELLTIFEGKQLILLTEFIIIVLLASIENILLIYVSIAIGQLFSKHKIIASFVAYAVIYHALQLIMLIIILVFGYATSGNIGLETIKYVNMVPQVFFPFTIITSLIGCIVFFTGTNYIFKRKLNLD